jgi:hypothetical protein
MGGCQPDVTIPLNDSPVKDSKSEVGVQLKGFEEFERFRVLQSFVFAHGSFVFLVALPHLRFRVTAIKSKWECDIQQKSPSHFSFNM